MEISFKQDIMKKIILPIIVIVLISGCRQEEEKRRKEALARQLQASLENSASAKASENAGKMYGQQRYGTGKKK